MSKLMFVTMGTSLFHSASWEPRDGKLPCAIPFYEEWLRGRSPGDMEPAPVESPDARLSSPHSGSIRNALQAALQGANGRTWADFLPFGPAAESRVGPAPPMRFSAELATILKMHAVADEATPTNLVDFLASYSRIYVVSDSDASDLSMAAGAHLVAYLNHLAGRMCSEPLTVAGLSSTDSRRLLGTRDAKGALQKLAEAIGAAIQGHLERPEAVDLVISGGYKLYGVALARLAELKEPDLRRLNKPLHRLFYIHERGNDLMVYSEGRFGLARVSSSNPFYDPGVIGS
jgi:hypothetical protein